MNSFGIIIIGAVIVASLAWQAALFNKVFGHGAASVVLVPAALLGAIVVAGVFVYSLFLWIDPARPDVGFIVFISNVFFAVIFALILATKVAFGPIVLGINVAFTIYNYFEHGILKIWPVMAWIVELVVHQASHPVVIVYTIIFLLFTAVLNSLATFTNL